MTFRNFALTTTAFVLTGATGALADSNSVHLVQDGFTNEARIDQTAALNSSVGTDMMVARQMGDGNRLEFSQAGDGNRLGDFGDGFVQEGMNNSLIGEQRGMNNVIGSFVQRGDNNSFHLQTRIDVNDNHVARIEQSSDFGLGHNNNYGFTLEGSFNGHGMFTGDAASVGAMEATIRQNGDNNNADFSIAGNNNQFGNVQNGSNSMIYESIFGSDNQMALYYEGNGGNNILGLHTEGDRNNVGMRMVSTGGIGNYAAFYLPFGSDDNTMFADQMGDDHEISINAQGMYNDIDVVQYGVNHTARGHLYADNNTLNIMQDGNNNFFEHDMAANMGGNAIFVQQFGGDNISHLNLIGDGNNTAGGLHNGATMYDTPLFGGMAGDVAAIGGVYAGGLIQNGFSNTMDLDIGTAFGDASNNLFAAVQMGDFNSVTMDISGMDNQAAISQAGSFNTAHVTQYGSSNNVGILQ